MITSLIIAALLVGFVAGIAYMLYRMGKAFHLNF